MARDCFSFLSWVPQCLIFCISRICFLLSKAIDRTSFRSMQGASHSGFDLFLLPVCCSVRAPSVGSVASHDFLHPTKEFPFFFSQIPSLCVPLKSFSLLVNGKSYFLTLNKEILHGSLCEGCWVQ